MYSEADFQTAAQGICPGPDLEWFAADQHGNVAGFCNAGFAAVPTRVFSSYDLFTRALDAVYQLPTNGSVLWYTLRPPIHDTWDTWSTRGIFGYDWNHCIGQPDPSLPYKLMTRPENPINVSCFSEEIAAYLNSIRIPTAEFSVATEILV